MYEKENLIKFLRKEYPNISIMDDKTSICLKFPILTGVSFSIRVYINKKTKTLTLEERIGYGVISKNKKFDFDFNTEDELFKFVLLNIQNSLSDLKDSFNENLKQFTEKNLSDNKKAKFYLDLLEINKKTSEKEFLLRVSSIGNSINNYEISNLVKEKLFDENRLHLTPKVLKLNVHPDIGLIIAKKYIKNNIFKFGFGLKFFFSRNLDAFSHLEYLNKLLDDVLFAETDLYKYKDKVKEINYLFVEPTKDELPELYNVKVKNLLIEYNCSKYTPRKAFKVIAYCKNNSIGNIIILYDFYSRKEAQELFDSLQKEGISCELKR